MQEWNIYHEIYLLDILDFSKSSKFYISIAKFLHHP